MSWFLRLIANTLGVGKRLVNKHVDFARDLILYFNRWCSASGVKTFDKLCDQVVLEQHGLNSLYLMTLLPILMNTKSHVLVRLQCWLMDMCYHTSASLVSDIKINK